MRRIPSVRTRIWHLGMLLVAVTRTAAAAGPLGREGDPIATSNYGVDLTQTPVVAGARVTGLAGAYVAIAEGVDGNVQTPVAPAVRAQYSVDHFDYDLGLGLLVPATVTATDFFNTGHGNTKLSNAEQQGFVFVTPALNLAWGGFALGATLEFQTYALRRGASAQANARADKFDAEFSVAHLQAAQVLGGGDFVVGAGLRLVNLDVRNPVAPAGQTDQFVSRGAGAELGALWKPVGQPFRIGAAFRSAVSTEPDAQSYLTPNPDGDRILGDLTDPDRFYLPNRMDLPWDLNVGLALQIGPRPLNPRWVDPAEHDGRARAAMLRRRSERRLRRDTALRNPRVGASPAARDALDAELETGNTLDELHLERVEDENRRGLKEAYARMPRRYVLVSMSLVVTGQTKDAVGVESFLQRVVGRSGERLGLSPRFGVETEFIPDWVRGRLGTYGEPTRFVTSTNRLHGTVGFDVKLFPWSVFGLFEDGTHWRLSAAVDAAPRYFGWGVSIGVWH
jgi:hypothetical protein